MKRRNILLLFGGIVAALPVAHVAARLWPEGTPAAAAPVDLLAWFAEPQEIRDIGEAYLARADGEPDLASLIEGMPPLFAPDGGLRADLSAAEAHARFDERVARDFERGDVVTVDGWVLARTEARLCAMAALRTG